MLNIQICQNLRFNWECREVKSDCFWTFLQRFVALLPDLWALSSDVKFVFKDFNMILNILYLSSCRTRPNWAELEFVCVLQQVWGQSYELNRMEVTLHYQLHTTPQKPGALTESVLKRTMSVSIFNGEKDSKTNCFWHLTRHWCVVNDLRGLPHSSRSFNLWLNTVQWLIWFDLKITQ